MSAAPGCRVLLAAPCSPDRELLAVLLEDAGCIVQCIETPDEFSDIILHADCDLAVVDAVDASLTEAVRAIGTRAEDAVPILGMVPRDTSVSENANLLTGYISMPVQVQDIQGLLDALLPPEEALHTAGPAAAESFAAREPPIDWAMTAGEFGGDNDMVKTLVSQFLAKVHTQIEMLRIACSDPDLDPARAEAHKIKGGAANLNAVPLSEAARRLEQAAGSGDPEESRAALQALMTETERLTNFMENIQ
jgi:HPt (histidine-containing phosphotransfer) domain-containing protein